MKNLPRARFWLISSSALLALVGLGGAVGGTAGASTAPGLNGVPSCDKSTGNQVITWTVHNRFSADDTVTVVTWSPASTVTPLIQTIPAKGSGIITQTVAGNATSASLTIHAYVPGIDNENNMKTLTLAGTCTQRKPPGLGGHPGCDPSTGNQVITWTVHNRFNAVDTITVVSFSPGTITPTTLTLQPKTSGTLTRSARSERCPSWRGS